MMQQALKAGYDVTHFPGSPLTKSGITRCVKNGKELFFMSTVSALVPAYGVNAAENKLLSYSLLHSNGVATPETVALQDGRSLDEVAGMIMRHGSVVVKPSDTNHGDGITVNVTSVAELEKAIDYARNASGRESDILVQQQVFGREYRFLVVAGKVIAVANRRPPYVIGDGSSTVAELIMKKNKDPRRGTGHQSELTVISLDDVVHHNGEAFMATVPEDGMSVDLLDTSNLSRGGESVDVTDIASPALKVLAEQAAKYCFLGIAGVDIITSDIETGSRADSFVIEVNLGPGLRMHQFPTEGIPRDVAKAIFEAMEKTARPIGKSISHIGRSERVRLPELTKGSIPARIDTGATVTSIWASSIAEVDEGLSFVLFDTKSPYYTGQRLLVKDYGKRVVSSSMGHVEVRYKIQVLISLHGRRVRATTTLSDRSQQTYPILIGRNVLKNKFIVDVARGDILGRAERLKRLELHNKVNVEGS
jgi:D-alanine-D-alanine ligase-like ATP-grasp enzyme